MPRTQSRTNTPEIVTLIKKDHQTVKKLFKQFEELVENDPTEALPICEEILTELTLHAEMEEQIVYPLLQEVDEDLYYEAQEEHHVAKLLIAEIQEMGEDDPAWKAKVMVLRENVEHHIREEEREMLTKLAEAPARKLTEAAETWTAAKEGGLAQAA